MSVEISNFTPLERGGIFLLKWAYYLFFMGLLASPFVLLGVVGVYCMVSWWYDIFWLYVWAPEQWYPDWAEPKGNFRYASRETMEALCEYKRRYYHGRMRFPFRATQLPQSWDSPYMEGVYFALFGGALVLIGAWLFRKWGEWGLIRGLVKREPFAYIQLKAFVYEGCTLPFMFILSCLVLRYSALGGGGYGSLMKLCSLQSLQDAVVVAQPLLTWGENLLANVVPTIPAGGSVEAWLGLDPLYTWMVHDSVIGGYLEGSGGLAQSRIFTAQTLPQPLRLTALPRWEPSLPRCWGESLQELTGGSTTHRFASQGVGLDGLAQTSASNTSSPFYTTLPVPTASVPTFIGRVGQWLNYYSQYPSQLWASTSTEVTHGWWSGTGPGNSPPSGGLLSFMTLSSLSLPWRRVVLNQLLWPGTTPLLRIGLGERWPMIGCLHILHHVPRQAPRPNLRTVFWLLFGGSLNSSVTTVPPQTVSVPPSVRAPVVQWNDLFTSKMGELDPLHVTKKFSFQRINPLRFQTALSIWKDLRQQQHASYSYYHRVIGAFYAAPTVPPQLGVDTVIPQGLWRKQPSVQWLLGEGALGDRSSFVLSGAGLRKEIHAQFQSQTLYSELTSRWLGADWLGGTGGKKHYPAMWPTQFQLQNPWISSKEVPATSLTLINFTKLVAQWFTGGLCTSPAVAGSTPTKSVLDLGLAPTQRPTIPEGWDAVPVKTLHAGKQLTLVEKSGKLPLSGGLALPEKSPLSRGRFLPLGGVRNVRGGYLESGSFKIKPVWWSRGGDYGEHLVATQSRLKALYWYEARVKLQLKTGGYALPASGVLFDEGLSGWWYARQYFIYQLWNPLRRWCGVEVPLSMPPLRRVSLSSSTAVPATFMRAVEQGVIGWGGAVIPKEALHLKVEEVSVSDEIQGGTWRLKGLPINWEQQLAAQALTLVGRGGRQEYHYVPAWVADWWLGWLPTTYRLPVKWASLLPEWFTGIRVVPPTLLAQVRAAAVERPITWEVWAREYARSSLWTTLVNARRGGSTPTSLWDGGRYGFKLGVQPAPQPETRGESEGLLRSFWWSWAQASYRLVVTGCACGIDLTYLLATERARGTSWIKMCHLVFDPAWGAMQHQLVAAFSPLGAKLFYGAAGMGTFGLSLGFNSLLLVVQAGLSLQEYLPSAFNSWVAAVGRGYLPAALGYWLVGDTSFEETRAVAAPLLGAKIQFQPAVRAVSLQSFLHHYWMEALLQQEGVEGLAQRLVRNPQSWLAPYRGISQDQQFARLYKLLSSIEESAKRPLLYREGVPSDRLNYTWLVTQLKGGLSGWRVREETPGEFRFSAASEQYMTSHVKTRRAMRFLSVPQRWQEPVLMFLDGTKIRYGLVRSHLPKAKLERAHLLHNMRHWTRIQPSMAFEFKRSESLLLPRFGHSLQYQDTAVHYRIPRVLFQKLYQYEYHHPLTWGVSGHLAPLPVEQSGGGVFQWWWPARQTLPIFRQAGLPPQHYYTRLETEVLGPLLGFLREYNRFAFSSALHESYYRKYGDIMAYMTFHYPQYTLADIERVTCMPRDFRAHVARGVPATLPLEIQNHFITEPLQFGPFSASQRHLLTTDFVNEVRTQAPWLTLMREYFGPVAEPRAFWRGLAEAMATPCGWDTTKGGVYPLSHWVPITLAAEVEEEAQAQLTRRGLKTFLRNGEEDEQLAGKRYVFERLHAIKAFSTSKHPSEQRMASLKYRQLPRWLKYFAVNEEKLDKAGDEKLLNYIKELQKGAEGKFKKFRKLEYHGLHAGSPFKKVPHYTLGVADDTRFPFEKKFMSDLPNANVYEKRITAAHCGLLLKYPQDPEKGVDYLEGVGGEDLRKHDPRYRIANQWEETVRRAYRTKRRGQWWWPGWIPGKSFSFEAYRAALHGTACSGPEGYVLRPRLSRAYRNFYSDLFSRLEFQTMVVPSEGLLQWQQEQVNYTQSFFAGYHFSSEKGEAVSYPLPNSQSDWAKAYFVKWPARLEPLIKWTKDWAIFLATFDLDQLRRLEGAEKADGAVPQTSIWKMHHRTVGGERINHRKVQYLGAPFKEIFSVDSERIPRGRMDGAGGYGILWEGEPPLKAVKDSDPYLWQDTYTSKGIWRPRGVAWKGYQRSLYTPYYDKLLPKGTPIRKPWAVNIHYTGVRPCSRRRPVADWSAFITIYQWMRNEGRIRYTPPKLTPLWWQLSCEYHGIRNVPFLNPWEGELSDEDYVRFTFPIGMLNSEKEYYRPSLAVRSCYYSQWVIDEAWWRWWRARLWGLRDNCVPIRGGAAKDGLLKARWLPAFGDAYKEDWQPYYFLRPLVADVPVEYKDYHKASLPFWEYPIQSQIMAWHFATGEEVKETGDLPGQFILPAEEGTAWSADHHAFMEAQDVSEGEIPWVVEGVTDKGTEEEVAEVLTGLAGDAYPYEGADRVSFLCHWLSLNTSVYATRPITGSWHLPWLRPQWIGRLADYAVDEPFLPYVESEKVFEQQLGESGKLKEKPKHGPKLYKTSSMPWGEPAEVVEHVPLALAAVEPLPELPEDWGAGGVEDEKDYVGESRLTEEEVAAKVLADERVSKFLRGEKDHRLSVQGRSYLALPQLSFFRPYYLLNNGVEYVGRPDAAVAVERADLARLYQQIEGVATYYNNHQHVSETLARIQIPLGEYHIKATCRATRRTLVNLYNFPSLRLWQAYNGELGAYYSHLTKRGVPRALDGLIFSGGSGVRFRYPEIFTPEQCLLQQRRAAALQQSWGALLWSNLTTLWRGSSPSTRGVRVDPPLYHNLWTHRGGPEAVVALQHRLHVADASILQPAVATGGEEHTALWALRKGAQKGAFTEEEWQSLQSAVAFVLTPETAEKYVAVEKRLAVLFREVQTGGVLVGQPRHRLDNRTGLEIQKLAVTLVAELNAVAAAEKKEMEARCTPTSKIRYLRVKEFKAWRVKHEKYLELYRLETQLWEDVKSRMRELLALLGEVVVSDGPIPEALPEVEDGVEDDALSWWAKVRTWLTWGGSSSDDSLPAPKAPLLVEDDAGSVVGVEDAGDVAYSDFTYDNYLAVRGPRAALAVNGPMVEACQNFAVKVDLAKGDDDLEDTLSQLGKWSKRHRGLSMVEVGVGDFFLAEDVASRCSGNGLVYPTSFNPFHYYNPHADWRAWWVKTRIWTTLDCLRPVWASQASHCGAPINAPYERWREFSRVSYHQRRGGLVWQWPLELPVLGEGGGEGSSVEARQALWRQGAFTRECRRDFLRLCNQWNRLVVLPLEVEQQSTLQQYWSRLYEGLRPENLLRRYVYTQAPYRRGFADYVRYRYALSHPTRIDPRCWVDPTLWDEARRGGYCMLDNTKVVYTDGQDSQPLLAPITECNLPVAGVAESVVAQPQLDLSTAAPQFIYPPYYYRPLGGALDCERSKLGVRWEGPGTIISWVTCAEGIPESASPLGGVRAYECPTQVRGGGALQRFTLPPLKHRSALSYMVDYRAERVWVPERQCYSTHQGWREYVVPNRCGVRGKRELFWLNRWVGDPVLLRWDWNHEPVGVQAFLFNPKGLEPKKVGFLTL